MERAMLRRPDAALLKLAPPLGPAVLAAAFGCALAPMSEDALPAEGIQETQHKCLLPAPPPVA